MWPIPRKSSREHGALRAEVGRRQICVDDTLSKGVESWAGTDCNDQRSPCPTDLLMSRSSVRRPAARHPQKRRPTRWPHPGQSVFSALGLQGDHTEARILGALARCPVFLSLDAVCQAIGEMEWAPS